MSIRWTQKEPGAANRLRRWRNRPHRIDPALQLRKALVELHPIGINGSHGLLVAHDSLGQRCGIYFGNALRKLVLPGRDAFNLHRQLVERFQACSDVAKTIPLRAKVTLNRGKSRGDVLKL